MVGRIALLFVIVCSVVVTEIAAQSSRPSFEVASIKRSARPLGGGSIGAQPGGRFSAVNMPLSRLIEVAYGVRQPQLIDAPDWFKNETFDVNAKAAGEATAAETLLMLRISARRAFQAGAQARAARTGSAGALEDPRRWTGRAGPRESHVGCTRRLSKHASAAKRPTGFACAICAVLRQPG